MNRGVRAAGWITCAAAIVMAGLGLSVVRLSIEGERAMNASDREFDQGRLRESLLLARRAADLYAPGLRHVERANARLDAIAAGAETSERQDVAVLAWQSIRSIELQRSWVPRRPVDRLRLANQRLAALLADDGRRGSMSETQQFSRQVLTVLERGPSGRTWLKLAGFGSVVAGLAAMFIGLDQRRNARAWLWGGAGLAGIGAIAWAILLPLS